MQFLLRDVEQNKVMCAPESKSNPKPMTNLLLSVADKMGAPKVESFRDSTGRLGGV